MNLIEAVELIKSDSNIRMVKEEWRDGNSDMFEYFLCYNELFETVDIIDVYSYMRLDAIYDEYASTYYFDTDDILYNKYFVWED